MSTAQKLLIVCILNAFILVQSDIVIKLKPEEVQYIGEQLVESYLRHNLIQRQVSVSRTCLKHFITFSTGIIQMVGVTLSLIAANVFTPIFQSSSQNVQNSINMHVPMYTNITKKCNWDYGCEHNICWRQCGNETKNVNSWCYTASNANSRDGTICQHANDCSPCWPCISVCHTPTM